MAQQVGTVTVVMSAPFADGDQDNKITIGWLTDAAGKAVAPIAKTFADAQFVMGPKPNKIKGFLVKADTSPGTRVQLSNKDVYKFVASGSGTNEYYCTLLQAADPSLADPDNVAIEGSNATEGTVGSLTDGQWDYGDNDSLGYSTVYVRDDAADPDSYPSDHIYSLVDTPTDNYDLYLMKPEGVSLVGTNLENRDAYTEEQYIPSDPPFIDDELYITVEAGGNAKKGTLVLYFTR